MQMLRVGWLASVLVLVGCGDDAGANDGGAGSGANGGSGGSAGASGAAGSGGAGAGGAAGSSGIGGFPIPDGGIGLDAGPPGVEDPNCPPYTGDVMGMAIDLPGCCSPAGFCGVISSLSQACITESLILADLMPGDPCGDDDAGM